MSTTRLPETPEQIADRLIAPYQGEGYVLARKARALILQAIEDDRRARATREPVQLDLFGAT